MLVQRQEAGCAEFSEQYARVGKGWVVLPAIRAYRGEFLDQYARVELHWKVACMRGIIAANEHEEGSERGSAANRSL